jgi:hypothetical protein
MPEFIDWEGHGTPASAPPANFLGATAHAFAFDIVAAAAQATIDKLLAPAAAGKVGYTMVGDTAFLAFVDIARSQPLNNPTGWLPGREVQLWLPLWETPAGGGIGRPVLWCPYVWINYGIGLIAGREVWGWAKEMAAIALASDAPAQPADFRCDTTIFRDFGPDVQGETATLVRVSSASPLPTPSPIVVAIEEVVAGVIAKLFQGLTGITGPSLPVIALKQFRDSATPAQACYQAIVNSPCELTGFRGAGFLPGGFTIDIANCRSHQILPDLLGTPVKTSGSTQLPVSWGVWSAFDFVAQPGTVVAP